MAINNYNEVEVKQRWRCWPNALEKSYEPHWLFEQETEIIKAINISQTPDEGSGCDSSSQQIFLSKDGKIYKKISCEENKYIEIPLLSSETNNSDKKFKAVDICNSIINNNIILISNSGKVVLANADTGQLCEDTLKFKSTNPLESSSPVEFVQCASGDHHLVLVDSNGKAWSSGKGPQTGHITEHLKYTTKESISNHADISLDKIAFFQGLVIRSICCGADFNIALVERTYDDEVDSNTTHEHGYERHSSAISPNASLRQISCPLGLPITEACMIKEDGGVLPSDQVEAQYKTAVHFGEDETQAVQLRNKSSRNIGTELSEGMEVQVNHVERFARSGMYMNPQDALKFLSDQLSWIGSGIGGGTQTIENVAETPEQNEQNSNIEQQIKTEKDAIDEEIAEEDSKPESSNVANLGRAAGNLVSAVGQTMVSKLTKSFSIDSSTKTSPTNEGAKKSIDSLLYDIPTSAVHPDETKYNPKIDERNNDTVDSGIPMDTMSVGYAPIKTIPDRDNTDYETDLGIDTTVSPENGSVNHIKLKDKGFEIEKNKQSSYKISGEHFSIKSSNESPSKEKKSSRLKNSTIQPSSFNLIDKQKRRVSFQHPADSTSSISFDSFIEKPKNHSEKKQPNSKDEEIDNVPLCHGERSFNTDVLFWGKGARGQPGQGDMLDRLQPSTIDALSGIGVMKLVCGRQHCLGKCFLAHVLINFCIRKN